MIDQLFNIIQGVFLIKISIVLLTALLFVFLLVVLKQSFAMRAVIDDRPASEVLNGIALFNVFVGFSFFIAALIVL